MPRKRLRPPDPVFQSTDAYFRLRDTIIHVPFVAVQDVADVLRTYYNADDGELLQSIATHADHPLEATWIEFYLSSYGSYMEYGVSREICPRLSQSWAVSICHNVKTGKFKDLPWEFTLVRRDHALRILKGWTTGDGELMTERLARMKMLVGQTKTACGTSSRNCTIAMAISSDLLAIWADEPGGAMSQGAAIYWLVTSGMITSP